MKNRSIITKVCASLFALAVLVPAATASAAEFDNITAPRTMTWEDGDAMCKRLGGTLPSVSELTIFSVHVDNSKYYEGSFKDRHWPAGVYWTADADDQGHKVVYMPEGRQHSFPDNAKQWVVCRRAALAPVADAQ